MQIKIISHWSEQPSSKNLQTRNGGDDGGKRTLLHYWWKCKLISSHYGEEYGESLK